MLSALTTTWRRLAHAPAGTRFQQQYDAHRRSRRRPWIRAASVVAGVLIVAVGIIALPAPGPGMLVIALGGMLLARQFRAVARALDWLEVALRRAAASAASVWRRSTPVGKAIEALAGIGLMGVAALVAYSVVSG